ncbi:hypothetical protein DFH09DRAFT_915771, partial [Mycena vulgaris]
LKKMPSSEKTIAAVSQPRSRQPAKPRAPLTAEQKKEKHDDSEKTRSAMDEGIQEWFTSTMEKAEELAVRFDKKPRYFLDVFFQGGARMVHCQEKINPYNAFKSEKAAEVRKNGGKMNVPELHKEYYDEYARLTDEEKAELVQRFSDNRADGVIHRDTPRARVQDVANTVRNMRRLMDALSIRVGIEGFFLIVRNNSDFHIGPQWHWTSPDLERYMPLAVTRRWDQAGVGAKVEAFALAGGDTMSTSDLVSCGIQLIDDSFFKDLLCTAPQKAAYAKREICDMIVKGLSAYTTFLGLDTALTYSS